MPRLERPDGVELHWEERGEGPLVVVSLMFFAYPAVFEGLVADLARDHRVVTWDARGTGQSTHSGPYDLATDVGDLSALIEAAGGEAVLVEFMAPRSIRLASKHPELAAGVVVTGTAPPLGSAEFGDMEGFASSVQVIDALDKLLESDYRAALRALLESTNSQMDPDQIRARVDETEATIDHQAAVGRLRALRAVRALADEAGALGERLAVVCFETPWYTGEMVARTRELLPMAQIDEVEDGPISRPDLTARAVRRMTAARAAARER
jgi:pimeloyl-ACP methyl ester carboxylesterase